MTKHKRRKTRIGRFLSFGDEMLFEERIASFAHKVLRCQHARENRYSGLQLDLHEAIDHSGCDEFMAVNATINNQRCGNNTRIGFGCSELFDSQWDLKRAGYLEHVDRSLVRLTPRLDEGVAKGVDDVFVPARLNQRDSPARNDISDIGIKLSHLLFPYVG